MERVDGSLLKKQKNFGDVFTISEIESRRNFFNRMNN